MNPSASFNIIEVHKHKQYLVRLYGSVGGMFLFAILKTI